MKENEIEVLLEEYRTLKAEQISRIGFRDNLVYVTLGAVGAIASFVLSEKVDNLALLVVPWVCLILGWTYLVNDEKISSIGEYIKTRLTALLAEKLSPEMSNSLFNWEAYHRENIRGRKRRKFTQLVIDVITFVGPGIGAILAFDILGTSMSWYISILVLVEIIFLIYLTLEIVVHSIF